MESPSHATIEATRHLHVLREAIKGLNPNDEMLARNALIDARMVSQLDALQIERACSTLREVFKKLDKREHPTGPIAGRDNPQFTSRLRTGLTSAYRVV
jgi:hypothetical protein